MRHQADADEHAHQHPAELDGGKTEILDDLEILTSRNLGDGQRSADEQQRERSDTVEDTVPDVLLEDVPRDEPDPARGH